MRPKWTLLLPGVDLGFLPMFLDDQDERKAVEQLNSAYWHGGGWHKFDGFVPSFDRRPDGVPTIQYPGDPTYWPLAYTRLRDELIVFYPHAWVGVFQPDQSFEIARMD